MAIYLEGIQTQVLAYARQKRTIWREVKSKGAEIAVIKLEVKNNCKHKGSVQGQ